MCREPMKLYIHIPFCVRKCQYCDFLSFGIDDDAVKSMRGCSNHSVPDLYIEALCREIRWYGHKDDYRHRPVTSVFFGGGTPSLMSEKQILRVMGELRENFLLQRNAEITMEANPGTLTKEKLRIARLAGINRLSIGLQSANENELKLLGRIHSYETFLQSFRWAREAGFKNLNVDLITALPDQTTASYENTLKEILSLEPEHISAYSLIIEPGTPFEEMESKGELNLPDEEEERCMYAKTREILEKAGYARYEISNYAKPGYACRHNEGYWRRVDYLGLGLGASSLIRNTRFTNTTEMNIYIEETPLFKDWYESYEILDTQSAMEEFMFLGLRMIKGVSEKEFYRNFGKKMMEIYGSVINKHIAGGLLKRQNGWIALTEQGLDLANVVMADFML